MNKKTKAFLWVIGAVLVLLGAAMVLYSVGLTSGWFGGETAEPPQASSSTPAPEDDQKLLEIEEIPQDGMMTPNQVYEKVKHSVVAVVTYGQGSDLTDSPISSGSGIVFSEDGYIVTNSHVIGDSNQYPVKVVFTGQDENEEDQEYPAQIVGYDKRTDIAVLKIDAAGLTPAEFADSDQLKVGDTVLSLGNPGVAGENFTNTLTKGMVSAVNRTVTMSSINMQYIQTDAAINPGNSGGPLLDSAGRLIGINTAIYSPSGASAGIGFAVPVDTVMRVVPQLIKTGKYIRPALGIEVDEQINARLQALTGSKGVFVLRVTPGSAAHRAGLVGVEVTAGGIVPGDRVISIDGIAVDDVTTLQARLDDKNVGDVVVLLVERAGKTREMLVELQPGV